MRLQKVDWSNFAESNDFSWGTNRSYLDWPKATVYDGTTLVWGIEPPQP